MKPGTVNTGRRATGHTYRPEAYCVSCRVRLTVGEPKPSNAWAKRLRLTEEQIDLLLVAFAEFMEHGGGDPIDALDWIRPDVLGLTSLDHPEFAGRTVTEAGNMKGTQAARHTEPFPLPRMRA